VVEAAIRSHNSAKHDSLTSVPRVGFPSQFSAITPHKPFTPIASLAIPQAFSTGAMS
jgi:hypothetical protein